ncbi:hypothetical protein DVS28_a4580 [Euzebya pacifica]|uniref:Uncharacterized protein n=1 Tax=Euzebya pacifica TaxID=1608957 RepID=A0A346Y444_9ACTN|nr:hypothetical protein [Euzebya pacifica]AXV09241.1 hypothetical protein DVS28_a4580 [Euzebya pacifica]
MRQRLTHKTFTAFFAAVLGSVLLIGTGAGADPVADVDGNNISAAGDNQVNAQACHNQVPVNALGVQVPVQEVAPVVGADALGDGTDSTVEQDDSCNQAAGQSNDSSASTDDETDEADADDADDGNDDAALVDASGNNVGVADDNQVNAQVCHNQVPVNALGVQVPVQEIDSALGLGLLNDGSDSTTAQDEQCNAESAQQNSSNAEDDS